MATNRALHDLVEPEPVAEPVAERDEIETSEADRDRERLARAVNDLEAAKARVQRDARLVHEELRQKLVSELLPVLDNIDRAIAAAEASGDAASVIDGVRLVQRQLETVLSGFGLVRFDAVGTVFDPAVHDAIQMVPVTDPAQDRLVVEQLQPGYKLGDRLLRAAKVIVGKHAGDPPAAT